MAGNIRLSPDELRDFATQYSTKSNDVHAIIGELDGMIGRLKEAWEGSSSDAFAGQYEHLKPSFQQMGNLLEEISVQLKGAAGTLEDTDNQIAGKIGY